MKKFVIALLMLTISISSYSQFVSAPKGQTYKKHVGQTVSSYDRSLNAPNHFPDSLSAIRAYQLGRFLYYDASDRRTYTVNPVDGVNRVLINIEQDAAAKMVTRYGVCWVITKVGKGYRWYQKSDGCVAEKPYAYDECGNAVYDFFYLVKDEIESDVVINNYSNRSIYTQPYKKPGDFNYNNYKTVDPYQPVAYKKQGWSTGKKIVVAVVVAAATYAIVAYATKSHGGSDSEDQVVVTDGASRAPQGLPTNFSNAPKSPGFGLSFGVRIGR